MVQHINQGSMSRVALFVASSLKDEIELICCYNAFGVVGAMIFVVETADQPVLRNTHVGVVEIPCIKTS